MAVLLNIIYYFNVCFSECVVLECFGWLEFPTLAIVMVTVFQILILISCMYFFFIGGTFYLIFLVQFCIILSGTAYFSSTELLYRSDFFPGLGWMLEKKTWLELEDKWPKTWVNKLPIKITRIIFKHKQHSTLQQVGNSGVFKMS